MLVKVVPLNCEDDGISMSEKRRLTETSKDGVDSNPLKPGSVDFSVPGGMLNNLNFKMNHNDDAVKVFSVRSQVQVFTWPFLCFLCSH